MTLLKAVRWRFDFVFRFADTGAEAITAHQVGVFIGPDSHKPREIPAILVDAITKAGDATPLDAPQQHVSIEAV